MRVDLAAVLHGDGIVSPNLGSLTKREIDHDERLGVAHIVGIRLEREPEKAQGLPLKPPQSLLNAPHEVNRLVAVDPLDLFDQFKVVAEFL